jgi:hypothetical protein
LFGFDDSRISDLAARTTRLALRSLDGAGLAHASTPEAAGASSAIL